MLLLPAAQALKADAQSSDYGYEHVVQPSESLSEIASAYGTRVKVIVDENGITDPNRLRVGQKLFIPD